MYNFIGFSEVAILFGVLAIVVAFKAIQQVDQGFEWTATLRRGRSGLGRARPARHRRRLRARPRPPAG